MSGLPGIDDLSSVGGAKADYEPVEDPTTDLAAAHWNVVAMNATAVTQTAARAWVSVVGKASSPPDDPVSNVHGAVWGNAALVKPTMARTGAGVLTATWPTSITDALGISQTVNLRRAWASAEGTVPYFVTATVTAVNVVTLRIFNAAGAANDAVGVTFTIFVT